MRLTKVFKITEASDLSRRRVKTVLSEFMRWYKSDHLGGDADSEDMYPDDEAFLLDAIGGAYDDYQKDRDRKVFEYSVSHILRELYTDHDFPLDQQEEDYLFELILEKLP